MWSSSAGPPPDPLPRKQSFWDRPGLLTDRALIESSLVEPSQRARFLAAHAPHSGDWLLALPIANSVAYASMTRHEAVRVAVGMRLGLSLCNCHCGTLVDAQGLHAWSARRHRTKSQDIMFLMTSFGEPSLLPGSQLPKSLLDYRQTRWQTSRRANLNPMARWPFVSLGRSSAH